MTRGQWTLIGLLVVQAILIAVLRHPEADTSIAPHKLVPTFESSAVTKVEVGTKPDEKLTIERDGSDWKITSADGYPADSTKVNELIRDIGMADARTAVVTSSKYHESLEVTEDKAQARVRLYQADSDKPFIDLIVGKATTGGAHVRVAGEKEVYDVQRISPWQLRPDVTTWMQRTLTDIPPDSVEKLVVSNENGTFELEKKDSDWLVVTPEESKGRSCNADKVDPIVRAVASLTAAGPGGRLDPAKQGLGDGATTVTLTHHAATTTVRIGGPVPDKNGQVYVTRDGFGFAATQWDSSLGSVRNAKLEELLP